MSSASLITEITQPIAKAPTAKWSYISLIFTVFYVFPVALNYAQYSNEQLLSVIAIYGAFIGLFLQVTRSFGRKASFPIAAIILLSAFGASVYPGTNILFGYAAYFSGYYFKSKGGTFLLAFNVACQLFSAINYDLMTVYFLGPSIAASTSLYIYGVFSRKDAIYQLNQDQQSEQIEQLAAIAERERIARDMHDLLGHSLSSLALKSELAQKLIDKGEPEKAKTEISEVAALSRKTLSEVREAVTGLKKKSLQSGIVELIDQLEHFGFKTHYSQSLPQIEAKIESTLLILCKEWVTNILRHSRGNEVAIKLSYSNDQIRLLIKDNGSAGKIVAGNGISGIQSRVNELSGCFRINTSDGVALDITFPNTENSE